MKNPESLTGPDLDYETFRNEFAKITQAKIKEIREAREGLLRLKLCLSAFSTSEGEAHSDFYSFFESDWLHFDKSLLAFFPETNKIDEYYISTTFKKLLSVDYVPPQTELEIAKHLAILESYYISRCCPCQPQTLLNILIYSRLDLSLSKLMKYGYMLFSTGMIKGVTGLSRAKNTNLKKKAKAAQKKELVLREYQHMKRTGGLKKKKRRQVAKLIQEKLKTFASLEMHELPSLATIERYFETIPEIKQDLKEEGDYWYFQT